MKKYKRMCIVVVAVLSLAAMFVYRYKYNTLLSLLEIGKFFSSKPAIPVKCLSNHSDDKFTSELEVISNYLNHWTEIFDGIYVYSPYVLSRNTISLAYSSGISVNELKSITCSLWFEKEKENLKSNLDVHLLNGKNTSFLFYMECRPMYDLGDPNAITFMKNAVSRTIPVFHKHLYTGQFAACVSPLPTVFSDINKTVEFLAYHSKLGIKHFILYYTAFSSSVSELLVNIVNECDIKIEFRPWITPLNFDHLRLKLQPYFIDCMFHLSSLNHSDFVFLLDINHFMVLEETKNLKKLVYSNSPFDFLQLEQKVFCLEYPDDVIAKGLDIKFNSLLKTKMSEYNGQELNVVYDLKQLMLNIGQIPEGFKRWLLTKTMQNSKKIKTASASIFSYTNCFTNMTNFSNASFVENNKMWSYKPAFFKSCIYKRAKSMFDNDVL